MTDAFNASSPPPIGHNRPPLPESISMLEEDFAGIVTDWLQAHFPGLDPEVADLLDEARALPSPIPDDDTKEKYIGVIKRLRDLAKRLDGMHGKEKTPYLRGGQAIDQFFFGFIDRLARRAKANKPGAADILGQRLTEYDTEKLRQEQARRAAEAAEAARNAREAQEKAEREAREAEEARSAAERARKPETKETKSAVAVEAEGRAVVSNAQAAAAVGAAEAAYVETLSKPADIMRTRTSDGALATMATEPYAVIEDDTKLDMAKLWPFIKIDAKEAALRAWAKTTGHNQQMDGAKIGRRPKSVVR